MASFKVPFEITDYKHILPSLTEYEKHDEVINVKDFNKGNLDKCVWKKELPTQHELSSPEFKERELTRILRTGAWCAIKDTVLWLPPNYYWALKYTNPAGNDMEFRLQRLMHCYFKIHARNTPHCKGTMTIKARQTGETSMAMADAFWGSFEMEDGQVTINSKTRNDAQNPCWKTMQAIYMGLPKWLFDTFFGDCQHNGKNIAETIKFLRFADESRGIRPKNVLLAYYPSVYNALDGKNSVKEAIGDEFLKWLECNFGDWLNNASKFIMPGFQRSGMFNLFSSPPEKDSQSFRDGYELWKKSDPSKLDENGTTESRIHRYYINPLHGIQGAYDKWGDADPERIYDWIMRERKRQPKDKLLEEIRGFPLNEEEIWGSMEGGQFWSNQKGISERKIYLLGTRFKNEQTKEPIVIYGNLEWKDGIKDNIVQFRPSDKNTFDVYDSRLCISHLPEETEPLKKVFNPPNYVESCIGIDSVDKRYAGKNPSNFAMVNYVFRDIKETGIVRCPTMIYCNRPLPIEIAYEDAIKAAVFFRSMVQVESLNTKIVDYFEDRGYINWMISKIGQPRNSLIKGDAPSGGKSAFMDEIVGMIDALLNVPLNEGDPYPLKNIWFYDLLDDISKFSLKDTHARDLTMALGQATLGSAKLLFKKQRVKSELNEGVMDFLLG